MIFFKFLTFSFFIKIHKIFDFEQINNSFIEDHIQKINETHIDSISFVISLDRAGRKWKRGYWEWK